MSYYFPLNNLTSSTNITGVAQYANEVTGGMFWLLIFFALWSVLFMSMAKFGEKKALTSSSFITALVSYMLAAMGLINVGYVLIPTAITVLGVLIMGKSRGV